MTDLRVFYDTCIFVAAQDARGPLLDLQRVSWAIALSEISYAEATIKERLDALKVNCARQGIEFIVVKMAELKAETRRHPGLRKRLLLLGVQSMDCNQIFAAAAARASLLITRDFDFLDPDSKRRKNRPTPGHAVATLIHRELAIQVLLPKQALTRLLGS